MAEFPGMLASINISGGPVPFVDESTSTDDHQNYKIISNIKEVWDYYTSIVVKVGGVETAEEYTANKLKGAVVFASADALRDVVTVSGEYLPMVVAAYAYEYTYSRAVDLHEVPKFGDTYKSRIPGAHYAYGTLSQFDIDNDYFNDALTEGKPVVVEFRSQEYAEPERVWALLESTEMKAAISEPQSETVSFISTDEILNKQDWKIVYYFLSSNQIMAVRK